MSDDLAVGTLDSILKQAGLKLEGLEVPQPATTSAYVEVAA